MFFAVLNGVSGLVAAACLGGALWWWNPAPLSRRRAFCWIVALVLGVTLEHWILGPWSYAGQEIDQDFAISTILFDLGHKAGLWSHRFAGGQDVAAMSLNTGQYLSFQRMLIGIFPLWAAHGLNMILGTGLGAAGTYLAARRMFAVSRGQAVVLAGLFGFGHMHLSTYLWANGFGYGLAPLAIYLGVGRWGRRGHWWGLLALSGLHAVSCSPNQSMLGLGLAVVLISALAGWRSMARGVVTLAVMTLVVLLNWHESLYAKVLLAPFSYRGSGLGRQGGDLSSSLLHALDFMPVPGLLLVLALGVAVLFRRALLGRALLVALSSLGLGGLLLAVPWSGLGLAFLGGVNFRYVSDAAATTSILLLAWVIGRGPLGAGPRKAIMCLCIGVLGYQVSYHKLHNITSWLSQGGISLTQGGLAHLAALPPPTGLLGPQRSLLLPHRVPLNLPAAAGRYGFDGATNLYDAEQALFWQLAVMAPLNQRSGRLYDVSSATLNLEHGDIDLKCCDQYRLADWVDLAALQVAGVGEVLTTVPLTDAALRRLSADPGRLAVRNSAPLSSRLAGYVAQIKDPVPIMSYGLSGSLPLAFGAKKLEVVADDISAAELAGKVVRDAPKASAIIRRADWDALDLAAGAVVTGVTLGCDRADLELAPGAGGAVIFNSTYNPFWRAYADGVPVRVARANMIHMAVSVPPGARHVQFRYERPTLRGKLAAMTGWTAIAPDPCPGHEQARIRGVLGST